MMKSKKIDSGFILRLGKGEEIVRTLADFLKEKNIQSGSLSGIGGVKDIRIMYYDLQTKKYVPKDFLGMYEMTSLLGNISLVDGNPFAHLHITISDEDYRVFGGHLDSAVVGVTCEIVVNVFSEPINRVADEEFGLKFLDL